MAYIETDPRDRQDSESANQGNGAADALSGVFLTAMQLGANRDQMSELLGEIASNMPEGKARDMFVAASDKLSSGDS